MHNATPAGWGGGNHAWALGMVQNKAGCLCKHKQMRKEWYKVKHRMVQKGPQIRLLPAFTFSGSSTKASPEYGKYVQCMRTQAEQCKRISQQAQSSGQSTTHPVQPTISLNSIALSDHFKRRKLQPWGQHHRRCAMELCIGKCHGVMQ
eukprot:1156305-Pelagomonas_calceolata.AAC.6